MKSLMLALLLGAFQPPGEVSQLLVVTGLSGEPSYAATLASIGRTMVTAAKERWGLADSSIIYLAEQHAPAAGTTGRSDRDGVIAAITRLAAAGGGDGVTLILLAGHGSEQAGVARLNLPGPDLTAPELAMALKAFGRTVVVVNAASASGGFLEPLAAPNRIVITATKTATERNATRFGEYFAKGLTSDEADADKNGRISFAEAYRYARSEVIRSYQSARRLLTEHSQIDDNGDGTGSAEIAATGDGVRAASVGVPLKPEERSADPRVASLLAERRKLEGAIAALRGRKAAMDSLAYERELERLVLELAETNQTIRALRGAP